MTILAAPRSAPAPAGSLAGSGATLLAVALALNLGWEVVQRPLYETQPLWGCVRASFGDALLIGLVALATRPLAAHSRAVAAAGFVVALAVVGYGIEAHALTTGRWAYLANMPTVGVAGLTPLLQLPVTGSLAMAGTVWWSR